LTASKIEVKGPLISHSFLAENSMGLLVIYTWIVMVTVIAIVTMVIVKHKQQVSKNGVTKRFHKRLSDNNFNATALKYSDH